MKLPASIVSALENIYISPLELCNLNCSYCYTNKTKSILNNQQILNFVSSYSDFLRSINYDLKSILFCGGEVFTLNSFPDLLNRLLSQKIFVSVITNGTVDKLEEIKDPHNCQLLVSLDGPPDIHDQNRGSGNFNKTLAFIRHALSLGFSVEIMFLVSSLSYEYIDSFPQYLADLCGSPLHVNYITFKSSAYTHNHPLSRLPQNPQALTQDQILHLKRNYDSIPSKNFGCFQLSLQSNGQLYGCCESPYPLGSLTDPLPQLIQNFLTALTPCQNCRFENCRGCCAPGFLCGYKKELQLTSCQEVVKSFNHHE